MPLIDCVVECPVHDSFLVDQVAGMFDMTLEKKSTARFTAELPDEEDDWQIGAIVGPSGSGKSTIAKQAYGKRLHTGKKWLKDKAVIDGFGDISVKEIVPVLTAVGFSSPPAWVKPYHVLSGGEQFRWDLARAILMGDKVIAFD